MYTYPFSAIVGQEKMKLALILNAIQPAIGGVLIRGEKGTAKSTAVRALAALSFVGLVTWFVWVLHQHDPGFANTRAAIARFAQTIFWS